MDLQELRAALDVQKRAEEQQEAAALRSRHGGGGEGFLDDGEQGEGVSANVMKVSDWLNGSVSDARRVG